MRGFQKSSRSRDGEVTNDPQQVSRSHGADNLDDNLSYPEFAEIRSQTADILTDQAESSAA
jgi:hypothetical protein